MTEPLVALWRHSKSGGAPVIEVDSAPHPGDGGEIMGCDRRHGLGRPLRRRLLLEPQQTGGQHPGFAKNVADPGLNGPQVLADHYRSGPGAFDGQDVEEIVTVETHVGTLMGVEPLG